MVSHGVKVELYVCKLKSYAQIHYASRVGEDQLPIGKEEWEIVGGDSKL